MGKKTKKWPLSKLLRLIELVRVNPSVWKPKSDPIQAEQSWRKVAASLGETMAVSKAQFQTLRDSYKRSKRNFAAGRSQSYYRFHVQMRFLDEDYDEEEEGGGPAPTSVAQLLQPYLNVTDRLSIFSGNPLEEEDMGDGDEDDEANETNETGEGEGDDGNDDAGEVNDWDDDSAPPVLSPAPALVPPPTICAEALMVNEMMERITDTVKIEFRIELYQLLAKIEERNRDGQ